MGRDSPIVGDFIDAVALDPPKAAALLKQHPELRDARWLHEETVLHFLAIEGTADDVRLLGSWGFDPNAVNEFGESPLLDVVAIDRYDVAAALLELGADPNAQSETRDNPLHCAAQNGNAAMVELLLRQGARGEYETDIQETIFDALPDDPDQRAAVEAVLRRFNLTRRGD